MVGQEFELLAPAGSFLTFKAVIEAGADAIYVGGNLFGARAYADNFSEEELLEAIDYAHIKGCKVYLTVNTLLKNEELKTKLYDYLLPFYVRGIDAVLVQDFGVLSFIHDNFPNLPIHTSTQMTVTGIEGALFLKKYGVTRIVMAREVSLTEMKQIHQETGMELEAFVHGALCYSYSGQCLFSSLLGGRSGNRGRCAQPCRLPYSVLDENKKEYLKESYVLSLKDMCGIDDLPGLNEAGVYSLKIEGRMKQAEYAAGVVLFYRKYIDQYVLNFQQDQHVSKKDLSLIEDLGNRCGFTDMYYHKHNDSSMVTFVKPNYKTNNEELHKEVHQKYVDHQKKIGMDGYLYLHKGDEAVITLSCMDYSVSKSGIVVSEAKNKPASEEDIDKRIRKTGDTIFVFHELIIDMDDDIFVPNGALNQLRRAAIEELLQCILKSYKRQLGSEIGKQMLGDVKKIRFEDQQVNHIAAIEDREQLAPLLDKKWITTIYVDWNTYLSKRLTNEFELDVHRIKEQGKECYLILPAISRNSTMDSLKSLVAFFEKIDIDGFVVKTYEELYYVTTYFSDKKIVIDHNLYTYNDVAVEAFIREGASRVTIPVELNRKEILNRDNKNSELIIYGHYPLMTSAQCIHKNTRKCDRVPGVCYLKDRYQKVFPVKNCCNECYNIIYNSVPVMLAKYEEELIRSGINNFRWSFTIETPDEISKLLDSFENHQINGDFTNGHYKRGVE